MLRRTLLVCGILSSALYAGMTVSIATLWPGYSSASQTISELSAIGAPTRSLWLVPAAIYTILVAAFGWGVSTSAGRSRALRLAGAAIVLLLFACGALTFAEAPKVGANLPTPWMGVWERINVGVFLVWVVVLAAALWRAPDRVRASESRLAARRWQSRRPARPANRQ